MTNNIGGKPKSRKEFFEALAFSLLEEHLKQRAKVRNLPLEIKAFLTKYRETPEEPRGTYGQDTRKRGPCHERGKHKNNTKKITCSQCSRYVCKKHSRHSVTCFTCVTEIDEDEDED